MSDYRLGYFPIAGPKNSSSSLERCHAVSFCIFFVPGDIKAAEKHCSRGSNSIWSQPQLLYQSSPSRQLTACRLWWGRRRSAPVVHQYNQCGASTSWHSPQIWSAWHHVHHQSILLSSHLISPRSFCSEMNFLVSPKITKPRPAPSLSHFLNPVCKKISTQTSFEGKSKIFIA